MKRYFRWDDDDIVGTMYIEVDNGYATKQIAVTSNKYIASNRKDETHHFYLTEGIIDVNNMIEFGGSEINEKQFYCIWNKYRDGLIDNWNLTKERFPIGSEIEGIVEAFYPQGIIVNISQNVIGIADYFKSKDSTKPENLYPQHKIIGKVVEYDEENMWLVIDNTRVF